jgi:signal peptidase
VREPGKKAAKTDGELKGKARVMKMLDDFKLVFFAIAAVGVVLLCTVLYSGLWPPLVVVESGSMQHSDTVSSIDVIDTGDLVIVKQLGGDTVRTYVASYSEGYSTYGSFGDVIIYKRYGSDATSWIIHRAVLALSWNESSNSFNVPDLINYPRGLWSHNDAQDGVWWSLSGVIKLYHYGYKDQTVTVNLGALLQYAHGGYITKGDHNDVVDQYPTSSICREPIKTSWIVGLSRSEVPWFGLLKLWATGQAAPYDHAKSSVAPDNSWTDLFATIALIVAIPLVLDLADSRFKKLGLNMWSEIGKRLDPRRWRR